jgi:hypothetical protein
MPLHLTKIAFGCDSLSFLSERLASRAGITGGEAWLTTRYRPKRAEEIVGGAEGNGSLYWIIAHRIVARSPILRFDEAEGGRTNIVIAAEAIPVVPHPKRAHQGWRYLAGEDAPADLAGLGSDAEAMPQDMRAALGDLGLV